MKANDRTERFIKLAEKRVSKAINDIRLIGNLASPNYQSTIYQINCIKLALENVIAEMLTRFEIHYQQEPEGFSFISYETDSYSQYKLKKINKSEKQGQKTPKL